MKRTCKILTIIICLSALILIGVRHTMCADNVGTAKKFVTFVSKGDYTTAVMYFDDAVLNAMPADKLGEAWTGLESQVGSFKSQTGTRTANELGYNVVYVGCKFENSVLDIKTVFGSEGKIAGLWFVPHTDADAPSTPAPTVKNDKFTETLVSIGKGKFALPGTLTVPKGSGKFPAVVLVHGSGPNDRDETIGPNKPFRDLAWGLAERGVAVLRYDKRSKVYPAQMAGNITVKEEVIDDALSAAALLRQSDAVKSTRVFILGHSMGGMLIPRIGVQDSKIAGFIVMAGAARPLEDAIVQQTEYLMSLKPSLTDDDKKHLAMIKAEVAKIKDPNLDTKGPAILGGPRSYWLDLRGYDPPTAAKQITKPILIIQGGRDYQVTTKEFDRWKSALSDRKDVSFNLYPDLNHLFIKGEGKSTPAEYSTPGHVSKVVIEDIASWVKAR